MTDHDLRQRLCDAGLVIEHQGQGDMTRGHVSVRSSQDDGLFFMKPHGFGFDEITLDNMLTIDLDGQVVAGTSRRHSEVFIHTEIYRARPDVRAVIHAHPTHVVALSQTGRPIRPLSQGGAVFAEGLAHFDATMDLIRTPEQGRMVARALGGAPALCMKGHGVCMTGRTLDEAVVLSVMLEEAARIQLLADAAGGSVAPYPPDDIARLRAKITSPEQYAINFDYLVRKARRAGALYPSVISP